MSARPTPRVTPRWPARCDPPLATVTLDYPADTPGLMSYADVDIQDIDEHGVIRRITSASSTIIPGGISLTYPSQDALYCHVALMRRYREKLAAFDEPAAAQPNAGQAEGGEAARVVFSRLSKSAGRQLARQAQPTEPAEARQEALL